MEVSVAEAVPTDSPVGVHHVSPRDLLATRPRGRIPAGYFQMVTNAAVQTDDPVLPPAPTWEELRIGLERARALDQTANRVRAEAFEALERYAGITAEPHPEAAYWRKLATAKAEEAEHVVSWRAERRTRLLREREAEEAKHGAASEKTLGEARYRAEEAALQAARARWEEARRDEERAAADLGLAQERPPTQPQMPPGAGRARHCFVCW